MTGKMPGPFEIEWVTFRDAYENPVTVPTCTAITMITSGLSMLKVCVDLNLLKIHVKDSDDSKYRKLAGVTFVHIPVFVATAIYRLSALSILIAYVNYPIVLPVAFVIIMNIVYGGKK